jgi:molybdopterin-guanine dinucleotide biosynthesis protein A
VWRLPEEIGGYVLAGGESSRMGRDKALLELAGKPLLCHAVKKLRRVCMDVRVLSSKAELASFAPLVPDLHPGCGPMGGMEAALAHSIFDWNLFLAVDMPFLPSAFVDAWARHWLRESRHRDRGARVRMFLAGGRPQPGFCLLHRDVKPFLTASLERGEYKLLPSLAEAGRELAARGGFAPGAGLWKVPMTGFRATRGKGQGESWWATTGAQQAAQHRWFANLNTLEEFADAERNVDALDT